MRINFIDSDEEGNKEDGREQQQLPGIVKCVSRNIVMDDWCVRTTRRVQFDSDGEKEGERQAIFLNYLIEQWDNSVMNVNAIFDRTLATWANQSIKKVKIRKKKVNFEKLTTLTKS